MKKLSISLAEDYSYIDKTHLLYLLTPIYVRNKINNFIRSDKMPDFNLLTTQDIEDAFNRADELIYPQRGEEKEWAKLFNSLTSVIAALAFVPYGVEIFGFRYEVVDASRET